MSKIKVIVKVGWAYLYWCTRCCRHTGSWSNAGRPGSHPSQRNLTRLPLGMSSGRLKSTTWRKFDFTRLGKKST